MCFFSLYIQLLFDCLSAECVRMYFSICFHKHKHHTHISSHMRLWTHLISHHYTIYYKWNLNTRFIDMFAMWEMIELYHYILLPPVDVRTQTDWQFPFIPFWINQLLRHMTTIGVCEVIFFFPFLLSNSINGYD